MLSHFCHVGGSRYGVPERPLKRFEGRAPEFSSRGIHAMPRYFELTATDQSLPTLADADALAGSMSDCTAPLGVRILALRRSRPGVYVYSLSTRRASPKNAVVGLLKSEQRFAGYRFSAESDAVDGPFA
jgi:hypothetical protein